MILVLHDMLGLTAWQPAFAEPLATLGQQTMLAAEEYVRRVARRAVSEHRYEMRVEPQQTPGATKPLPKASEPMG